VTGTEFIQQLINGLSLGAIYALIALGYTMVFGVLRFINFAHGDLLMVGAYTGILLVTTQAQNLSQEMGSLLGLFPSWRTGFLIVVAVGVAIDLGMWIARGKKGQPYVLRPLVMMPLVTAALFLFLPLLGRAMFGGAEATLGEKGHAGWATFILISSMLICAGFGMSVEQICYRPLRNQPRITVLITAIGVSLLLESLAQFGFGTQSQGLPPVVVEERLNFEYPWPVTIGSATLFTIHFPDWFIKADMTITNVQVVQFCTTLFLLGALAYIVKCTKLGMAMRALAFNPTACSLMGVNINFVIAFTFGLGSALAGAAGILTTMQQSADPLMGVNYGLKAFVAAVLGGIGNLPGAVLGALLIGVLETLTVAADMSTYRDAVAFAVLIVILLVRPAGLLGKNIREKV
jgi:branched-chain amino acid transport system permease protein